MTISSALDRRELAARPASDHLGSLRADQTYQETWRVTLLRS
jgi:hypothetical protein